jgi:hypothetical protein
MITQVFNNIDNINIQISPAGLVKNENYLWTGNIFNQMNACFRFILGYIPRNILSATLRLWLINPPELGLDDPPYSFLNLTLKAFAEDNPKMPLSLTDYNNRPKTVAQTIVPNIDTVNFATPVDITATNIVSEILARHATSIILTIEGTNNSAADTGMVVSSVRGGRPAQLIISY